MRKALFFLKWPKNNSFVFSIFLAMNVLLAPYCQAQQNWPSQPIRIIVTFTPGGAPDTLARILSEKLQNTLGVPIMVENKPGAGGNIGADYVAKSKPDGYTLLLGTVGTQTINPYLYTKIPYNAEKDFTPISFLAATPNLLVVNNQIPAKTIEELIAYAKSKPGELTFGSSGSGTSIHLSGELFKVMAGVDMTHIPYKGRASSIPDLIGGRITMIFDNMPSAIPLVKDGSIRAIAVTSLKRSRAAPEIPTISESGLEGFNATSWFALLGPANLPKPILDKLNLETNRVLDTPEIKERLLKLGLETNTGSPDQLNGFIKEEAKKWSEVVKKSGAKAE